MKLNMIHLYPELMSLYGEYANLAVLCRHLQDLGVETEIRGLTFEDEKDFSGADLIYMGAGTERSQKAVLTDLQPHAASLKAAAEAGAVLLFTGNAMEALGASVTDKDGKVWQGLGFGDFTTVETDRRTPHDVLAAPVLWEETAVGFMNKCSTTAGITTPLFSALSMGFGNEADRGPEGYADGGILATHLTGPVLVKNPDFTDLVIRRLFFAKGWPLPEKLPVLPHEREAYAVTLRELQARLK